MGRKEHLLAVLVQTRKDCDTYILNFPSPTPQFFNPSRFPSLAASFPQFFSLTPFSLIIDLLSSQDEARVSPIAGG